ncbi:LysR family transcriptional regulator [Ensifer adhaerens]|uniref:LysR family transcriptional regulator n=1 Tax=Ensifer adhaerens TaxID=106592 RepID=UPI00132EB363|nr:LysR family transcriptional regulator [Ensifer adhaerens]QHG72479.1 LysR family transcriptional regulator [Ensifer adhaerens]
MRRFDHLADVEAFITVMDKGSMTAGAVALATTPSVLSRAITRLETKLGTQLVRRTTRRISLTDAGRVYLDQVRAAFETIDQVERAIQGDGVVAGRVRLSAPTTYGHFQLPEKLTRFATRHPSVTVELSIANRNVDLVAEGYDLAIRLGQLPDSGMIGRRLEDAPLRLVASPGYVARRGMPRSVDELAAHTCLPFIMPSSGRPAPWLLRVAGADLDWIPHGPIQVEDDVLGTVSLTEAGLGICQTYDFIARDRLARGSLVELLPEFGGRSRPFSLIYPPHRNLPAATRALIDCLVEQA